MSRLERRELLFALAVLFALGAIVAARFRVTTDIASFLPRSSERQRLQLGQLLSSGELSRTMVLNLGAPNTAIALRAGRLFERELRAEREVAAELSTLAGGPPPQVERSLWALYQPRLLAFAAPTVPEARALLDEAGLRQAARQLKRRLAEPTSTFLSRLAPADPLLILPRLFERLEQARVPGLALVEERFVARAPGERRAYAVLFASSRASAFDAKRQAPLLAAIDRVFQRVNRRFDGALVLEQSGINRFAVKSERAIRGDIGRISLVSTAGLSLLLLVLFRSLRLLGLASIPLGAGVLAGCAAVLLVFGRIHGVTLAFGASLLGVSFDYVVHLYCHHAIVSLPAQRSGRDSMRAIGRPVALGAATTMLGFIALGASGFGGLREVALFASAGIAATVGASRFILPAILPAQVPEVRARERAVEVLGHALDVLRRHRRLLPLLLFALGSVLVVSGGLRLRWNDSFATLAALDPGLVAEEERVRARVSRAELGRVVAAIGENEQAALAVNDRVAEALRAAVGAGELGGFRSAATLLPSAARQRAVAEVLRSTPQLKRHLVNAFTSEGFRAQSFAPFFAALDAGAAPPLRFAELERSPLGPLVRSFRAQMGAQVVFLSLLQRVEDARALRRRLEPIAGAVFVDQEALLRRLNRDYQREAALLLGGGLLAVLLLLALRYRNARETAAAFLPALFAGAVAIAVLALAGFAVDLVVLTSLLITVSIGVDYGVFLVEGARARQREFAAALLSIALAGLSTVMGFALLGLSAHPVLRSIGLTAGVGIAVCLIAAPVATIMVLDSQRIEVK